MNPLKELNRFGQSIWFDNISRDLLTNGELERMIDEYAVTGITSNPSIFEKAISAGDDYDGDIRDFVAKGLDGPDLLTALFVKDITLAAKALLPVYEKSRGRDGFVSIEVNPLLARDAAGTIKEARELHSTINMPNILLKVPATVEGVEAVEELLYDGLNINVTLLFSVDRYRDVARAYVRALQRRLDEGRSVDGIFSVASFFVSRVDNLFDTTLEEMAEGSTDTSNKEALTSLAGKVAVANAKLAYIKSRDIFGDDNFGALGAAGAGEQKLLWASTSTKNKAYSDIKYVEELVGKETINTVPLNTMLAFKDHGTVGPTLASGLDEAGEVMASLSGLDINYTSLTDRLEDEGVKAFADSYESLLAGVMAKKDSIIKRG
ncbi:MAG: transaldolase [Thermodesulfobacteriota bacterium]